MSTTPVLAISILGIEVPDERPAFLAALAVHVAAGLTAVIGGALAATARKRAGRHPVAGTVYLWALAVVFGTATVLAGLRWRADRYLFVIACVAFGLGAAGWLARRRRWHRWLTWHGIGMAGSYMALLTGFYVDNGPQLPLWNRLPHWSLWLIPSAVGIPLTWRALIRNGALPTSARRATRRTGGRIARRTGGRIARRTGGRAGQR
jgi:hypothetical protein